MFVPLMCRPTAASAGRIHIRIAAAATAVAIPRMLSCRFMTYLARVAGGGGRICPDCDVPNTGGTPYCSSARAVNDGRSLMNGRRGAHDQLRREPDLPVPVAGAVLHLGQQQFRGRP